VTRLDRAEARRRLSEARVGRLATADAGGVPHVVPFVFVLDGDTIYWTVDGKPKRAPEIKRLANIRANPNVEVIVDRYEERWDRIWWIRAAGPARVVESDNEAARALDLLAEKYPQYRTSPPPGPVVAIQVARLTWWEGGQEPAGS
jgi:PPOX class probable F420-dependent enzyme